FYRWRTCFFFRCLFLVVRRLFFLVGHLCILLMRGPGVFHAILCKLLAFRGNVADDLRLHRRISCPEFMPLPSTSESRRWQANRKQVYINVTHLVCTHRVTTAMIS